MSRSLWVLTALLAVSVQAQNLPRLGNGKPDLQGIWQVENPRAADDLARLTGADGIPYLQAAKTQQQQNFAERATRDPFGHCWFPSTPRIMLLDSPFQIFQNDDELAFAFQWQHVYRHIPFSQKPSSYAGVESWMGRSRAHWEGDELVVDVSDFNNRSWLDGSGNHHSAELKVSERYRLVDNATLRYSATLSDAKTFTKPWTITVNLKRKQNQDRILETECQSAKEEANGMFERDERTWYPAKVPAQNVPFDAKASMPPPLPTPVADPARNADGTPKLGGYYMTDAGGTNYGLESTKGNFLTPAARGAVIDPADRRLPYQSWARAERTDREQPHRGYDDPTAHCFAPGLPRALYVPSPFHIMQTSDYVVFLHERMAWRIVSLKRKEHLPDATRLWLGDSIGHWEGDTLVVDSRNFNGKTWHNEVGDVSSHMQTIAESFTPIAKDKLSYRATVSDPIPYTRPWTIELRLDKQNDELLEVACLEDNNDLQHLKDVRDEWRASQRK